MLKIGDNVKHPVYGWGIILSIIPSKGVAGECAIVDFGGKDGKCNVSTSILSKW